MNRKLCLVAVLLAAFAVTGCGVELFCLEYHVKPQPTTVAVTQPSTEGAAAPRSGWEVLKSFITIYPFMKDVLAAIEANKAVAVPVEYTKRFCLLRVER